MNWETIIMAAVLFPITVAYRYWTQRIARKRDARQ